LKARLIFSLLTALILMLAGVSPAPDSTNRPANWA